MNIQSKLSVNTMWEATISNNPEYDGVFFYAVKTTMIFCRPSCKSRIPNIENVSYYFESKDAQREGYRPCKRCRPDMVKPYTPYEFIIEDTVQLITNNYSQDLSLNEIAEKVGVSRFHLHRIFKEKTGLTPRIFLERVRVDKAKEMLLATNLNSTEICYQIGFQSISSFYNSFKRNTGFSPNQFRTYHNEQGTYWEGN